MMLQIAMKDNFDKLNPVLHDELNLEPEVT